MRDYAERDCFRPAQLGSRFIEIHFAGGTNAFDVAPVWREIQIGFENLILRIMPFQFECAQDLLELSGDGACVQVKA